MTGVLYVLIENSLFGDNGLSVEEIQGICNLSESKVRDLLKALNEKDVLNIEKDGRKKLYSANLDKLD